MRILLSNDDGYGALGLEILYHLLHEKHSLFMVAPKEEKSGCGQALTMYDQIRLQWHDHNRIALAGYPSDCVNYILGSMFFMPELVVSGVNHGANMGADIYYSGTVAAARHAYLHGINGIAFSLVTDAVSQSQMEDIAPWIDNLITAIPTLDIPYPFFYNVNIPDPSKKKIQGYRLTRLGKRVYHNQCINLDFAPNTKQPTLIKMEGKLTHIEEQGHTDFNAIADGYISITPLHWDSTDTSDIHKVCNQIAKPL